MKILQTLGIHRLIIIIIIKETSRRCKFYMTVYNSSSTIVKEYSLTEIVGWVIHSYSDNKTKYHQ